MTLLSYSVAAPAVQRGCLTNLLGERLSLALRWGKHVVNRRVEEARHLALERQEFVTQIA